MLISCILFAKTVYCTYKYVVCALYTYLVYNFYAELIVANIRHAAMPPINETFKMQKNIKGQWEGRVKRRS